MAELYETRHGVIYCNHDGAELAGDLFLPTGPGPHPALVAVHGGGWRVGARASLHNWGQHLAARGTAVFSVSYRLAAKGKKTYPGAAHDIVAAVQYLRGEAKDLRIDSARIGLMGASAGAHLSALVGLGTQSGHFLKAYPNDKFAGVDATVKVVVGIFGVYDMYANWVDFNRQTPGDNATEIFLGCTPMDDRKLYFDASPISYATFANNKVRVFLSWGTEDDLVNVHEQSEPFLLALKQAGFFARTSVVQGAPHYWTGEPMDEPGSFTGFLAPRLIRFLADPAVGFAPSRS
jgi:acetyl esterase/lipase